MFSFRLRGLSEFEERSRNASRKLRKIFSDVFKQEKLNVKPLFKEHILNKYAARPGAFKYLYPLAKRNVLKVEAGTFSLPVITYFPHFPKKQTDSTGTQRRLTSYEIYKGERETEPRGFVWKRHLFYRPPGSKSRPVVRRSGPSMFTMCMDVANPCVVQIVEKCQDEVDLRLANIFR